MTLKALVFDLGMRFAGQAIDPRRRAVVGAARGRVLELGVGTGQNLRFYDKAVRVVGVEPDVGMLARAKPRAALADAQVSFVIASGEALPFAGGSFDEVVATLVL